MTSQKTSRHFQMTNEDITNYQRDGAICLRQLLRPEEVALLRDGIEDNLKHPSPRAKLASRPDDPGRFIEDFCCWQQNNHYSRFIFRLACWCRCRSTHAKSNRTPLSRSYVDKGTWDLATHTMASGSTFLQYRRADELQHVDQRRSSGQGFHFGVCSGFPHRPLANASVLHG